MGEKQTLHVIKAGKWLILAFAILAMGGLCLWFLFGEITVTMERPGIITDKEMLKSVYYNSGAGRISDLFVSEGDNVSYGDVIGYINIDDNPHDTRPIYAPTTGTVVSVNVRDNDLVDASVVIAKIAKNQLYSDAYVYTLVPLDKMAGVDIGTEVRVKHTEYNTGQTIVGTVCEIIDVKGTSEVETQSWVGSEASVEYMKGTGDVYVPVKVCIETDEEGLFKTISGQKAMDSFEYDEFVSTEFVLMKARPIAFAIGE